MKRLVIYFHYDPAGCIDTACRIAVQAVQKYGRVVFVTNGTLAPADRVWVRQSGAGRIERENVGFDVGAYREALLTLGREKLAEYEEIVLMNYTLAGPVCSLAAMFTAMDARPELDFWGLTRHYAMQSRRFGGAVPEHLQSHFIAVRPRLFNSDDFWSYWQGMALPTSYEQSIIRHETRFTPYFAARGYAWDTYVQTDDLKPVFVNPIMACPRELLANRGCPFFKRRSLFTPYADELRRTDGLAARELCDYVTAYTDFPLELLLVSLLKTQPLSALAQNLHWCYPVGAPTGETPDLNELGLRIGELLLGGSQTTLKIDDLGEHGVDLRGQGLQEDVDLGGIVAALGLREGLSLNVSRGNSHNKFSFIFALAPCARRELLSQFYMSIPIRSCRTSFCTNCNAIIATTGEKSTPPMGGINRRNKLSHGPHTLSRTAAISCSNPPCFIGIHVIRQ